MTMIYPSITGREIMTPIVPTALPTTTKKVKKPPVSTALPIDRDILQQVSSIYADDSLLSFGMGSTDLGGTTVKTGGSTPVTGSGAPTLYIDRETHDRATGVIPSKTSSTDSTSTTKSVDDGTKNVKRKKGRYMVRFGMLDSGRRSRDATKIAAKAAKAAKTGKPVSVNTDK